MRKIIFALTLGLAMSLSTSVMAENNSTDVAVQKSPEMLPEATPRVDTETTERQTASNDNLRRVSLEYSFPKSLFGVGGHFTWKYFTASADVFSDNDNKDNFVLCVMAGFDYRYWFLPGRAYVEGQIGPFWNLYHSEYETEDGMKESENSSKFGLRINPRVGVRVFNTGKIGWHLMAGYTWDAVDLKFSENYLLDYFSIGIAAEF